MLDRWNRILEAVAEEKRSSIKISEETGISERTVRSDLQKLKQQNLIERLGAGPKTTWQATAKGQEFLYAHQKSQEEISPNLPSFVQQLPNHYRAFFSLVLYALIAEPHVRDRFEKGRPGFFLFGPKKTGKTTLFEQFGPLLGMNREEIIIASWQKAGKEATVRRVPVKGGYDLQRSPYFERPLAVFDDLHWAEPAARKEIVKLFHGERILEIEGESVELHLIPILILNAKRDLSDLYKYVDEPYMRRGFVLNTWPIKSTLQDLPKIYRRLQDTVRRMQLDRIPIAQNQLNESAYDFMRQSLKECLTETGYESIDDLAMEFVALGAIALMGGDERLGCYVALQDALLCWETMPDYVESDWRTKLRSFYELQATSAVPVIPQTEQNLSEIEQAEPNLILEEGRFIEERIRRGVIIEEWLDLLEDIGGSNVAWERKSRPLREKVQLLLERITTAHDQETLEKTEPLADESHNQLAELVEEYIQTKDESYRARVDQEALSVRSRYQNTIDQLNELLSISQAMDSLRFVEQLVQLGCLEELPFKDHDYGHETLDGILNFTNQIAEMLLQNRYRGIDGKDYHGRDFDRSEKAWPLIKARFQQLETIFERISKRNIETRLRAFSPVIED